MRTDTAPTAEWRDAAAYAPLLDADRSLLAWEWLRRDPAYRAAAAAAALKPDGEGQTTAARQFGLIIFEPPQRAVPIARPMWRLEAHPYVLAVDARAPDTARDSFDLEALRPFASILEDQAGEHLLLSDGLRTIRLDAVRGSFRGGPASLHYRLWGLRSAELPLLTLRRFLALVRSGRFSRALHRREARARRRVLMLRAADALAHEADQREIASVLLSGSVTEPAWRSREPSVRSRVQRLVRSARQMAGGGYRQLLGS